MMDSEVKFPTVHCDAKGVQFPLIEFYYSRGSHKWFMYCADTQRDGVRTSTTCSKHELYDNILRYNEMYAKEGKEAFVNHLPPRYY